MALVPWDATIVIRHIVKLQSELAAEKRIGLAYVYCDYATKDQSALDYVGALLRQLVNLSDEVSSGVRTLHNEHKPGSSPPRPLLESYELAFQAEVRRFDSVYIVVDALDECRDDENEEESYSCTRTRLLESLGNLGEKVHLLFTSRDEDPAATLAGFTTPVVTLKVSTTDDDIRTYVQARINKSRSLQCCTDSELRKKIQKIVTEKAAGMFLPAKLYFEILASTVDVCQPKKTNVDALRSALKNLPQFGHTQAWETYEEAYKKILKNIWSQSTSRVKLARQVLSWVIFTQEPSNLTLPVLQRALSLQNAGDTVRQDLEPTNPWDYTVDSGSEDGSEAYSISASDDDLSDASTSSQGDVIPKGTLLSVCRGLITMDKDSTLVRLVHYTAKDYFDNESVRADSFPDAQSQLTRSCMASLMSAEADHQFDQYSHRHWGHHAQVVENQFQNEIMDLVQDQKRIASSFQLVVDSLSPAWAESREPSKHCLTPLHVAAYFGLELTATHLMKGLEPEDIKAEDSGGWTAMNWAVVGGSNTLVRLLFQSEKDLLSNDIAFLAVGSRRHGVNIDSIHIESGKVSLGAALTLKTGLSFTKALPRAIRPNARDEVVRFLMENIPNKNIDLKRPDDERTLLSVVAENWQWGYVGILLERGASINVKDRRGNTPLLWALNCPRRKLQIRSITVSGESCLSIGEILSLDSSARASISDHGISERVLEPFICKLIGSDLEATNEDGRTALSLACESRLHDVVKELVEKGAHLNTTDVLGMTPLHYACCLPCFETVKIEALTCSKRSKTRLGTARLPQVPLSKHSSIARPIGRSVALLLQSGAEADAQNCLGETPFSLAEADGLESCVRLLNPLGPRSCEQAEAASACGEEGDYAKLLLAMLNHRSRFQVHFSMIRDDSTLIIYSSSAIETLSIFDEASVVLSGKPSIRCLWTLNKSCIEIREAAVIESLQTYDESQAIIHGSSRIQNLAGVDMSTLTINARAKIQNLGIFDHCVVYFGGDSQVEKITGLQESTHIIAAEARVEKMHIDEDCTVFSKGNSWVSAASGTGASKLTLMGQSFIGDISVFDTCAIISEGQAEVERITCSNQCFVLMRGGVEIHQIYTEDEAIVLAEGQTTLTTALGISNSMLFFDADTKIETIDVSDECVVALRGRSELTTMSSSDRSVFCFVGEATIANWVHSDRHQISLDGSSYGFTNLHGSLTVDWRWIDDQFNRVVELGRVAWTSAQTKLSEGEERRKKAEDFQSRGEEWSWEPTGEEPDVEYMTWPPGRS
ncbi:hypothetical protein B0J15DRAFT_564744 [Fusarium solani]|uniref:Nephrocystin 3-like N-terminal domain-containing protein n=1 Tax=Fusarium solani TaxID=169388 RepID=A0A9P9GUA9_FUSSL|nr:uncharacterized protein B0J15DRAFT_564744 [Fusarium solani]KAH7244907.1 hypothetical protein B0J15DRAFT_564744 [Fusarium solani]